MGSMQYGGHKEHAEFLVTVSESVATFEMTGLATRESVISALAAVFAYEPRPDVLAAVAHYDRCHLDTSVLDLMSIYGAVAQSGLPARVPTALVVQPPMLDIARAYCRRQGTLGILREAFTDRRLARAWALDMAALLRAQRNHPTTTSTVDTPTIIVQ